MSDHAAPAPAPPLSPPSLLDALARNWWLLMLRGVAAIAFGMLAFVWPGPTLAVLVIFFGAFMLVDGVFSLWAAVTGRGETMQRWWLALAGALGVAIGLMTFFWPGVTALTLILFIGAWSLVRGIFEIVGAIQLRKEIDNEWMLILGGALSVIFGLGVLVLPGAGALALVWLIAIYAIAFGVMMVAFAFRLKQHKPAG
jgi:uncharacterized membrane protein HdeD (DUF308 family)